MFFKVEHLLQMKVVNDDIKTMTPRNAFNILTTVDLTSIDAHNIYVFCDSPITKMDPLWFDSWGFRTWLVLDPSFWTSYMRYFAFKKDVFTRIYKSIWTQTWSRDQNSSKRGRMWRSTRSCIKNKQFKRSKCIKSKLKYKQGVAFVHIVCTFKK